MQDLADKLRQGNATPSSQKITDKTANDRKSPTSHVQKSPTRQRRKSPLYYNTSGVVVPVALALLHDTLVSKAQVEWTSTVRLHGLLCFLAWFLKQPNSKPGDTNKAVSVSALMAEDYVSQIKRPKNLKTVKHPLALLVQIGILEKKSDALFCHIKKSATYKLAPRYATDIYEERLCLSPLLYRKLQNADTRKNRRFNRLYPWREKLLIDLEKIGIAQEGRGLIAEQLRLGIGGGGLQGIVGAIDEKRHTVKVSERGTITTRISSFPRELRRVLTLEGEPTVSCDISHAHHCFLPRLISDRIEYKHREKPDGDLAHLEAERLRLVARLSGPDYYRSWCKDPTDDKEREEKKGLINAQLNMSNARCTPNGFYLWMRREFPQTYSIVESIKRNDHRNLSKQLQRFTSDAINGAMHGLQKEGIAVIPQTDALLCQQRHCERVAFVIGEWVFKESRGVCCKVNGVPYKPIRD